MILSPPTLSSPYHRGRSCERASALADRSREVNDLNLEALGSIC